MATKNEKTAEKTETKSKPRGPSFVWNEQRDFALVQAIREGVTSKPRLVTLVREMGGEDVDLLKESTIATRVNALRKQGVNLPKLAKNSYRPDVAALNKLLGGES